MAVSVVGFGGFAFVRTTWQAFACAVLAGIGNGSFWPSHSTLVAGLTSREERHNAYATQRVLNNLGIGVGGLVGGLIATTAHPRTYELLFAIDAATFVLYLAALALRALPRARRARRGRAARRLPPGAPPQDVPRLRAAVDGRDRGRLRAALGHLPGVREEPRRRDRARDRDLLPLQHAS